MQKYLVVIEAGTNNYSAFSPDVPGCVATGTTVEETVQEMQAALEFHLEDEDTLPQPKSLTQHIADGVFEAPISERYYFTEVSVQLPQHA